MIRTGYGPECTTFGHNSIRRACTKTSAESSGADNKIRVWSGFAVFVGALVRVVPVAGVAA